jgi:hypothetical protein
VAAVHSGWRGSTAEVVRRTVEAWVALGARPERLLAAVGPCIQRCCYEVSPELAARFSAQFGPEAVAARAGPTGVHLDQVWVVRASLLAAGLKAAHVDTCAPCTACDAQRFFSHRRDAGRTGRHLNFVVHRF